jgi:hypothetical protein
MKPKEWMVLDMVVEDGITLGWARAHKHQENPSPDFIKNMIFESVTAQIHEWFDMEDGDGRVQVS